MSVTKEQVIAAIEECVAPGENLGFFAKQEMDAGVKIGKAHDLYEVIRDSIEGQRILKEYARKAGQVRISKNIALLVIKFALRPVTTADDKMCSDYARVIEHMANAGASRADIVAVFANGEFKAKLREVRELSPKRKPSVRAQQLDVDQVQLVLKRAGSSKTILRTASIAEGVDVTDEQQLHDLVLTMLTLASASGAKERA